MYNSDPRSQRSPAQENAIRLLSRTPPVDGGPADTPATAKSTTGSTTDWSLALQTVLDQPPAALPHRLAWAGVLFACCFTGWAWWGQVNEVAHAQGKLSPKGEVYKIHPTDLGKVSQILVKEGQPVKAGQLIAALDPTNANQNVERLKQDLSGYQAQLAQTQIMLAQTRLQAETRRAIGSAATQAQVGAVTQATTNIGTTQAVLAQLQLDKSAQLDRLQRLQALATEGAIAQEQVFQVEQNLRDRQRTILEHEGNLQRTDAEVKRLQSEVTQKQAEAQDFGIAAKQQIQQMALKVTELQNKISETQLLITSAQTKLQQFFLYAPVDGLISTLNVKNIGEVMQPGQTIAEITPKNQPLVLVATLPNREAGFVKPGLPVQVKLDAYPFQEYGIVEAKVLTISPDAKSDQQLGPVYRVEVQLERHHIIKDQQKISFKSGQTATAEIVTRQRRIADLLFEPIQKMQSGINL
jgi:hemolysin D